MGSEAAWNTRPRKRWTVAAPMRSASGEPRLREKDLGGDDGPEHQRGVDRADDRADERGSTEHASAQGATGDDEGENAEEEAEASLRRRAHQVASRRPGGRR